MLRTAINAMEGLELLNSETIDLVISDYRMPEMNGIEFLKLVKEKYPQVIRIILTGQASTNAAIGAINEGAVYRFLTKPWNEQELKITLRQALEFFEILKGTRALINKAECQNYLLKNLETRCPEIMEEENDKAGAYFISEEEVSSLEEIMDKHYPSTQKRSYDE